MFYYEFLPEMTQNHEKIIGNGGWEGFLYIQGFFGAVSKIGFD